MVDGNGLTAILDWEFAGWSDPLEDLGWFCARCWRFGADALEAGGIGQREDFYQGYESVSGRPIDRAQVAYWEVMAHMNWAIIAIQQAERHLSGEEDSLLLALTGHIVPELEYEILRMTEGT
ncbi:Phosphotransferase enzyme family protein [compost metagenome]